MLKIKEIYELAHTPRKLTDWVMRDHWFPEISDLSSLLSSEVLEELQQEGRLKVHEIVNDYIDGHRVLEMSAVWFDEHPVFIVQCAGRAGMDFQQRWVTDRERYLTLVAYLMSKWKSIDCNDDDVVSPDTLLYPEEVFGFYGADLSERFGYTVEPKTEGYLVLWNAAGIVSTAKQDQVIVELRSIVKEPAKYIRRQGSVMEFERALTEAELASNPRLHQASMNFPQNRYLWYRESKRPADLSLVVSV